MALLQRAFIFLVAVIAPVAQLAHADEIPGFRWADYYYYSTDMDPIEVTFATLSWDNAANTYEIGSTDPVTKKFIPGVPLAEISLARAYVNGLSNYTTDKKSRHHPDFIQEVLPSKIVGNNLHITMTSPDGLPYSIVYETWPKHRGNISPSEQDNEFPGGGGKEDQLRARVIWANIRATDGVDARTVGTFDPKKNRLAREYLGEYDGFSRYRTLSTSELYFGDAEDGIRLIHCYSSPEDARAGYFCSYEFPINATFIVQLQFIDFRANGGRSFARDRIDVFKKTMCAILNCDRS